MSVICYKLCEDRHLQTNTSKKCKNTHASVDDLLDYEIKSLIFHSKISTHRNNISNKQIKVQPLKTKPSTDEHSNSFLRFETYGAVHKTEYNMLKSLRFQMADKVDQSGLAILVSEINQNPFSKFSSFNLNPPCHFESKNLDCVLDLTLDGDQSVIGYDMVTSSLNAATFQSKNVCRSSSEINSPFTFEQKYRLAILQLSASVLKLKDYEDQFSLHIKTNESFANTFDQELSCGDASPILTTDIIDLIALFSNFKTINKCLENIETLSKSRKHKTLSMDSYTETLKSTIIGIVCTLIPPYCSKDNKRLGHFQNYSKRLQLLLEIQKKTSYRKVINFSAEKNNSQSWLPVESLPLEVSTLLNYVIVLGNNLEKATQQCELFRVKIEKYEYESTLLNSLFITISKTLRDCIDMYVKCGFHNDGDNFFSHENVIINNINLNIHLVDIANTLRNYEILNYLSYFHEMSLALAKPNCDCFCAYSSTRNQVFLEKLEHIDESQRSLDSIITTERWGKYRWSRLLVQEFDNVNANHRDSILYKESKLAQNTKSEEAPLLSGRARISFKISLKFSHLKTEFRNCTIGSKSYSLVLKESDTSMTSLLSGGQSSDKPEHETSVMKRRYGVLHKFTTFLHDRHGHL